MGSSHHSVHMRKKSAALGLRMKKDSSVKTRNSIILICTQTATSFDSHNWLHYHKYLLWKSCFCGEIYWGVLVEFGIYVWPKLYSWDNIKGIFGIHILTPPNNSLSHPYMGNSHFVLKISRFHEGVPTFHRDGLVNIVNRLATTVK